MEVYESILPCSEVRFGSEREGRFVDVIHCHWIVAIVACWWLLRGKALRWCSNALETRF